MEIKSLIDTQYNRAVDIIENNIDKLTKLAEALLKDEVIFKENLLKIFGERPYDKDRLIDEVETEKEEEITAEKADTSSSEVSDSNL